MPQASRLQRHEHRQTRSDGKADGLMSVRILTPEESKEWERKKREAERRENYPTSFEIGKRLREIEERLDRIEGFLVID